MANIDSEKHRLFLSRFLLEFLPFLSFSVSFEHASLLTCSNRDFRFSIPRSIDPSSTYCPLAGPQSPAISHTFYAWNSKKKPAAALDWEQLLPGSSGDDDRPPKLLVKSKRKSKDGGSGGDA
ncbi:hypothetical protein L1887_06302 [Cichorium endivia]|nr:hypothetical protein L1887_06302 [Cichorium endivia]